MSQSHWFIKPRTDDVLGDRWARQVAACLTRMRELDPGLTSQPNAALLWQWAMCELAEMSHRCVASPQAIAVAAAANGESMPDMDLVEPMLALSDRVLQEMFSTVGV